LVKMGAKDRFDVWYERVDVPFERSIKYLMRFLIFGAIFSFIWVIIDYESFKAFDSMLPDMDGSWAVSLARWLGFKVD